MEEGFRGIESRRPFKLCNAATQSAALCYIQSRVCLNKKEIHNSVSRTRYTICSITKKGAKKLSLHNFFIGMLESALNISSRAGVIGKTFEAETTQGGSENGLWYMIKV